LISASQASNPSQGADQTEKVAVPKDIRAGLKNWPAEERNVLDNPALLMGAGIP
jgi:hypothetical protein